MRQLYISLVLVSRSYPVPLLWFDHDWENPQWNSVDRWTFKKGLGYKDCALISGLIWLSWEWACHHPLMLFDTQQEGLPRTQALSIGRPSQNCESNQIEYCKVFRLCCWVVAEQNRLRHPLPNRIFFSCTWSHQYIYEVYCLLLKTWTSSMFNLGTRCWLPFLIGIPDPLDQIFGSSGLRSLSWSQQGKFFSISSFSELERHDSYELVVFFSSHIFPYWLVFVQGLIVMKIGKKNTLPLCHHLLHLCCLGIPISHIFRIP